MGGFSISYSFSVGRSLIVRKFIETLRNPLVLQMFAYKSGIAINEIIHYLDENENENDLYQDWLDGLSNRPGQPWATWQN
jgi:recombinational DNA repair protein (RecF pathway)